MNFKEWYENADMPEKRIINGKAVWVDLETGIEFNDDRYSKASIKARFEEELAADKKDEQAMLDYFGIDKLTFDSVTAETVEQYRRPVDNYTYKDAQKQLWHDYRANLDKDHAKRIKELNASFRKPRSKGKQKALDNAKASRGVAKTLGLRALTGTAKQKSWAESIRKTFLTSIKDEEALEKVANLKEAKKAKFWIETRYCSTDEILGLLTEFNAKDYKFFADRSYWIASYERAPSAPKARHLLEDYNYKVKKG